jgi:TPP-dependent pyruvate/acetoin dehydrogenase alpha subunit
MNRFRAYDPPEYVDWSPEPEVVAGYRERIRSNPERAAIVGRLTEEQLLAMYAGLVRNRLHDIALKRWVRSGVISKAWLGTGEEATTIGPVHALRRTGPDRDVVSPMIRNAGACHEMGMALTDMFRGYLGTADSPSGGRDIHIGDLSRGVLAPISHIADMVPVVTGVALNFRMRGDDRVALTWVGDGSTKAAGFHEGVNFAAVRRLPAVFIIQNNQVALGTPLAGHSAGPFSEWPAMYGVAGELVDGNHVLDTYAATMKAVERARSGGGVTLIVAETFRMGGHATHDEREARELLDPDLFRVWGRRDPIGLFEVWLQEAGIHENRLEAVESDVTRQVETAAEAALVSRQTRMPSPESAASGVYSLRSEPPEAVAQAAANAGPSHEPVNAKRTVPERNRARVDRAQKGS